MQYNKIYNVIWCKECSYKNCQNKGESKQDGVVPWVKLERRDSGSSMVWNRPEWSWPKWPSGGKAGYRLSSLSELFLNSTKSLNAAITPEDKKTKLLPVDLPCQQSFFPMFHLKFGQKLQEIIIEYAFDEWWKIWCENWVKTIWFEKTVEWMEWNTPSLLV